MNNTSVINEVALYAQVRIARPTDQLDKVVDFYMAGIGLSQIGMFHGHEGYTGIILGLPDESCHLEFTQHDSGSPCPAPTPDNLLVLYFRSADERDKVAARLQGMGYEAVEPANPYWRRHGITIEDPDGWRVVLMETDSFRSA